MATRPGVLGLKALDCLTTEDWVTDQEKDSILKRVKQWIHIYPSGVPTEQLEFEEQEVQAYLHLGADLRVIDGVL